MKLFFYLFLVPDDDECYESIKEARINDEDILKMINRPMPRQSNKDTQSMITDEPPRKRKKKRKNVKRKK